jgi:hypothetical protein
MISNLVGTPWALEGGDQEKRVGIEIAIPKLNRVVPPQPEVIIMADRIHLKRADFMGSQIIAAAAMPYSAAKPKHRTIRRKRGWLGILSGNAQGVDRIKRANDRVASAMAENLEKMIAEETLAGNAEKAKFGEAPSDDAPMIGGASSSRDGNAQPAPTGNPAMPKTQSRERMSP